MRISDWSSDVCSSDLTTELTDGNLGFRHRERALELDLDLRAFIVGAAFLALWRTHGEAAQRNDHQFGAIATAGERVGDPLAWLERGIGACVVQLLAQFFDFLRSEEHTSELQSL